MLTEVVTRVLAQPFFAGLPHTLVRELCAYGTPAAFPAGRRMFVEGEPAERFWLLESGVVALDLHVAGQGDQVVETIAAGGVLGWSWLYPPYRWQFGAVTREPVTAIGFDAVAVRHRCDADPELGYALLRLFTPVIVDRLQVARLRLLDLWGAPARGSAGGEAARGPAGGEAARASAGGETARSPAGGEAARASAGGEG